MLTGISSSVVVTRSQRRGPRSTYLVCFIYLTHEIIHSVVFILASLFGGSCSGSRGGPALVRQPQRCARLYLTAVRDQLQRGERGEDQVIGRAISCTLKCQNYLKRAPNRVGV